MSVPRRLAVAALATLSALGCQRGDRASPADRAPTAPATQTTREPRASTGAAAADRGMFLYASSASVKSGDFRAALAVPGIDGATLPFHWSELAGRAPRSYDFAPLDALVREAAARHVPVQLALVVGAGTPEWLFSPPPAGLGAPRLDFAYSHHNGESGQCAKVSIAPPWDATFLEAFGDLLAQLSAHLRSAGLYGDVHMLRLTGLNTLSEEMRLPAQTPDSTPLPCITDSIATWRNAGYRPERIAEAWSRILAAFQASFPDKSFSLAIIPAGAFPGIDSSGQMPARKREAFGNANALTERLVRAAAAALPGRFVLQHDFLMPGQPAEPRTLSLASEVGVPVAWQTNLYMGRFGKGAACGGTIAAATPCDEASFGALLTEGWKPAATGARVQYIEVFPADAVAFPRAVEAMHHQIAGR